MLQTRKSCWFFGSVLEALSLFVSIWFDSEKQLSDASTGGKVCIRWFAWQMCLSIRFATSVSDVSQNQICHHLTWTAESDTHCHCITWSSSLLKPIRILSAVSLWATRCYPRYSGIPPSARISFLVGRVFSCSLLAAQPGGRNLVNPIHLLVSIMMVGADFIGTELYIFVFVCVWKEYKTIVKPLVLPELHRLLCSVVQTQSLPNII